MSVPGDLLRSRPAPYAWLLRWIRRRDRQQRQGQHQNVATAPFPASMAVLWTARKSLLRGRAHPAIWNVCCDPPAGDVSGHHSITTASHLAFRGSEDLDFGKAAPKARRIAREQGKVADGCVGADVEI